MTAGRLTDSKPSKCPRCGTEGCPANTPPVRVQIYKDGEEVGEPFNLYGELYVQADIACSLRALSRSAEKAAKAANGEAYKAGFKQGQRTP